MVNTFDAFTYILTWALFKCGGTRAIGRACHRKLEQNVPYKTFFSYAFHMRREMFLAIVPQDFYTMYKMILYNSMFYFENKNVGKSSIYYLSFFPTTA